MKPILFAANATNFTSNGLGALDPTSCIVTEERNGQFELECVVPVDSAHFSDIANNMILVVVPGDGMSVHAVSQRQAFRIYHITEPLNGLVTINARHLSYDLSYNTAMPFTASTISTALGGIASHMVETNRFTFNTDKTTSANFKVSVPQTARQLLGGQAGSILDVYGGEYQWDNWTVNLWSQRGTDSNVTLRYGKNITDISQEENLENVVTGIVPYWANEDTVVTLTEKSVDSAYASQYPYKRTIPIDFSSEWEEAPTEAKLRTRAQTYVTANKIGVPKVSIKVSFVALWQTEEYKSVAPLERVHLCDTVGVVFEKYGINTRAEVIKTEYDCLAERYLSIELGEARSNFARTIVDMNDQTQQEIVEAKTDMQKAIDAATQWLTSGDGYVVAVLDTDGNWKETLYMDTNDVATATNVLRINMNGIGFSHNGINGPYVSAWTIAGAFNADFITTGTMVANRIRGGILQSSDSETSPNFLLNLLTGKLTMKSGSIKLGIPGSGSFWVENGIATLDTAILSNIYIPGANECDIKFDSRGLAFCYEDTEQAIGQITGGTDPNGNTGIVMRSSSGNTVYIQSSSNAVVYANDKLYVQGANGIYLSGDLKPTSSTTGRNGSFTTRDKAKLTFNKGILTEIDTSEQISTTGGTLTVKIGQKLTFSRGLLTAIDTSGSISGWSGTLNGIGDGSGNYYCDVYVNNGIITGWSGWNHV